MVAIGVAIGSMLAFMMASHYQARDFPPRPEKQADAYVDADIAQWSDKTTATMVVHYARHETEAEQKRRLFREREKAIRQEQKRAAALRAEEKKNQKNEERERAEYLRLKAKYEGG